MSRMDGKLSPGQLGAEILARIAGGRMSGVLFWESAGQNRQLFFQKGRPEAAVGADNAQTTVRQDVATLVRQFAVAATGQFFFQPQEIDAAAALDIDPFGEALLALTRNLEPEVLKAIVAERSEKTLAASNTFDKLAGAIAQMEGPSLSKPEAVTSFADLVGADDTAASAWIAVWALGGLKEARPLPKAPKVTVEYVAPETPAAPKVTATTSGEMVTASKVESDNALEAEIDGLLIASESQDHYEFMGLSQSFSEDELKKAYFAMAKKFHSDRFAGETFSAEIRDKAQELFRRAEEANRVLSDPKERKNYDVFMDRTRKGLPTDVDVIFEAEAIFRRAKAFVERGPGRASPAADGASRGNEQRRARVLGVLGLCLVLRKRFRIGRRSRGENHEGLGNASQAGRRARVSGAYCRQRGSLRRGQAAAQQSHRSQSPKRQCPARTSSDQFTHGKRRGRAVQGQRRRRSWRQNRQVL